MRIIADLHIHSKYSRATSTKMSPDQLSNFAKVKGVNLLGTGDFTHPTYLEELKSTLEEFEGGIYQCSGVYFMLTAEVNTVWEKEGKMRKVHHVLHAPSFEVVEQINDVLASYGDLEKDGRPTLELSAAELVEILKSISEDVHVVPAHAWTPWFGIFGSKSGFDHIKECYEDQTRQIFAIETGLSSDPEMNWLVSWLDPYALMSNSDAHSPWPWRLAREANIFELKKLNYREIWKAVKEKDNSKFVATVEVDPAYGKYHYDGHRRCNVCLSPEEAEKYGNICPVCRKPLTLGVLHRVLELADRPSGSKPDGAIPFFRLLPLHELLSHLLGCEIGSRKVQELYRRMIAEYGNEFEILLYANIEDIREKFGEKTAELISKNREGRIKIKPGYDGVYGKIVGEGNESSIKQSTLLEF